MVVRKRKWYMSVVSDGTQTAMKADNFLIFAGQTKRDLEEVLVELAPCVVERKVVVGGVQYPIVLSQPIPHGYEWNDDRSTFADCSIYLNNVGHCTFSFASLGFASDQDDSGPGGQGWYCLGELPC